MKNEDLNNLFNEPTEQDIAMFKDAQNMEECKEISLDALRLPVKITKGNLASYAHSLKNDILDNINPLEAYIRIKALQDMLGIVENHIKTEAITEAEKYEKLDRIKFGIKFSVESGRRTFDFSNDAKHCELKKQIKEREALLKAITTEVADADTGELLQFPIVKNSPEIIKIFIPE